MKPATLYGGCIGFGPLKAPLVLALKPGEFVQTRRMVKLPRAQGQWRLLPSELVGGYWAFKADGRVAETRHPIYRPGRVYRVGVPSFRRKRGTPNEAIYLPAARLIVMRAGGRIEDVAGVEWPDAERLASYCLPGWVPTMKLKCLIAEPQKLSQMSGSDTVEELVQGAGINADGGPWWDYLALEFGCPTALASYRTMPAAVVGRDVWDEGLWFWAYRFEVVERPTKEGGQDA